MGTIYVLHFDRPLAHAQHYIGFSTNLTKRLGLHHSGTSNARIMQVLHAKGIGFRLAHTQPGTRGDERKIKSQHHGPRFCPYCRMAVRARRKVDD